MEIPKPLDALLPPAEVARRIQHILGLEEREVPQDLLPKEFRRELTQV